MQPVLTITTNPAVDMATSVEKVVAGPKLRCGSPRWDPGGGGINVARAIRKLGGDATALVAVGGTMGERLLSLLEGEGVPFIPVPVGAETRISFAVTDETTGEQYRFGVPGEPVTDQECQSLKESIAIAAKGLPIAVFSGSVAPGLPIGFVSDLNRALHPTGTRLIVDTSAAALDDLLARPVGVFVLRLDQKESEIAANRSLDTLEDARNFAAELVRNGVADVVVMGRGAEGSVLVSKELEAHAWGPTVKVRSKIGAGDTFVGAFALSLARGEGLEIALKRGVAGAAATVGTEGTALCRQEDADALFEQCKSEKLNAG